MNKEKKPFVLPAFLKNPLTVVLLIVALVIVIFVIKTALTIVYYITHPRPPEVVSTVTVKKEEWISEFTAVAQLKSQEGALLKAEVPGTLKEIDVVANQEVKKGDLLLVIDADSERAAAKLAKLTYERAKDLRAQGVNTQNDLDQAEATYAQAQAALDKKEIRAPFDGIVGIPQVFVGQYIKMGDALIPIESNRVMQADFAIPQRMVGELKPGTAVKLETDARPGVIFEGKLTGLDPRLDENTLTVGARASFENKQGQLLSGMFGTVRVQRDALQTGIAVPGTAIVYSAFGDTVYVLAKGENEKTKKEELQVKQTFIKVLATKGDWVMVSGLEENLEIVTAGQMKLRNGAAVKVDNSEMLPVDKNPKPEES